VTNRQTDTRQCAVKTCFSCLTWSVFRECVHVETLQKLGPLNFKIKTHLTSCTSLQSTNSAVGRRLDDVEETRAKSGCWHNQPFACLEPHIIRIVCYCVAWWHCGWAFGLAIYNSQPVRFHVTYVNSALHPSGVAEVSTCFGCGQRRDSQLCRVAGNTVRSHMACVFPAVVKS